MMWLRRAMGMQDMEQPQPVRRQTTDIEARFRPPVSPIENNPVGWSSTYAPEVLTNPSPDFSPMASALMMTPEQKLGRFFNVATKQAKPAYTNADLPQLTAAGNEGFDAAMGWTGMTTPTIKPFPVNVVVDRAKAGAVEMAPNGRINYYVPQDTPWSLDQSGRDAVRAALAKELQAPSDSFYRLTNNANEAKIAKSGALRPSQNYVDNIIEPGVSVADGPHYAGQGYKYGYRVKGDVVGRGSDGEPVLNPKTIQLLSNLMPIDDLLALHSKMTKPALEAALQQRGWTLEQWQNFQSGFLSRATDK